MPLKMDLQQHMKEAMRAKDSVRLGVVRYLISEIRNWEIDNGTATDADAQAVIQRQVKQIKDGIGEFQKAGRNDLVESEQAKLHILESYLPDQMPDEELSAIVSSAITDSADKNLGSIMKSAIAKVAGKADGGRVSAEVKKQLAS